MKTSLWRYLHMSALMLLCATPLAHARETDQGTVIYEQDDLEVTVYAYDVEPGIRDKKPIADFCTGKNTINPSSYRVSVWYSVPHQERAKLITPSYEGFVKEKIYPSLITLCGNITISEITMRLANFGDITRDKWSETMIFKIENHGQTITKTRYIPNKIARANMSVEEINALMPDGTPPVSKNVSKTERKQLYSDGKITIYEHGGLWCYPKGSSSRPESGAGLDIIVPVSYNGLQRWLGSNYGDFKKSIIRTLYDKHCRLGSVNVKFYQQGQDQYLERVRYGWAKNTVQDGFINPFAEEEFMVLSRQAGYTSEARMAKIKKEKAILDIWEEPCDGVFCTLPGGAYFQAILDGDIDAVKRMDAKLTVSVTAKLNQWGIGPRSFLRHNYSVLPLLANRYLYKYKDNTSTACHGNLVKKTYGYQHAMHEMPDYNGMAMPDMGGEVDSATYYIPPEFVAICDRVCDAWGGAYDAYAKMGFTHHKPTETTIAAIDKLMGSQHCSSSTIKSFEKNLIAFTKSYLDNKKGWLDVSDAQPSQTNANSQPVVEPVPVTRSRQQQVNTTPTPPRNQSASDQATTENQMSEAERYVRMNAEIAALSETYNARLNRLNAAFQKIMQKSFSAEENSEMLRSFQEKLAALNAEAERETQKVKHSGDTILNRLLHKLKDYL